MSTATAIEAAVPDRVATVSPGGDLTLPGAVLRDLRLLRSEPFLVFSEGRKFVHMIRTDAGPAALLLEAASLRSPGEPPSDRRRRLVLQALDEWTRFQTIAVRNLLPSAEAGELVSYVEAIVRSA